MSSEIPTAAEKAVAKRHRTENFRWRKELRDAENLVKNLKNGVNLFGREDFEAIVNFMVDDKAARKGFIYRGVMKFGQIEIRKQTAGTK